MAWYNNYAIPMDRYQVYNSSGDDVPMYGGLQQPIFPIEQVGITVPENDATGRNKNMIQGVQAAIRAGTGTMQIVMQTPPNQPIGGRFKAYGKEVRQVMKEVAQAEGVTVQGVELPTSLSNLNGFDPQQGVFNDEAWDLHKREVNDAIRFVADIGSAGGIDVVSHEYNRPMSDQKWNTKVRYAPNKEGMMFEHQDPQKELIQFVDPKDGRIIRLQKGMDMFLPIRPPETPERAKTVKHFLAGTMDENERRREIIPDPETGLPQVHKWKWEDIKRFEQFLPEYKDTPGKGFLDLHIQSKIQSARGQAAYYQGIARREERELKEKENVLTEDQRKAMQREINHHIETAATMMKEAKEQEEFRNRIKTIGEFANKRTWDSYGDLGYNAWKESLKHPNQQPIHVGPEIGWPTYYGGHPDEFIEVVKKAREKMASKAMHDLKAMGYNENAAKKEAERLAKTHVKGLFDTSHLGMWLDHFKPELPWDARVKEFNKWYLKEVDKIVKADVVGDIQLVDAISGSHSHLPPGEGVLPLTETMQKFKDGKFDGLIVSEGHEEEKFEPGRIQMSAWKTVGANIGMPYGGAPAMQMMPMHHNYFGRTYSPLYMIGGYTPSNDFKLWSEVPFE